MKIVALVPFRNESIYLKLFMQSLEQLVDEIVGFDDGSTDESRDIFVEQGGILIPRLESELRQSGTGASVRIRNSLLDHGRRIGGTHFLIIDADEILVGDIRLRFRDLAAQLLPKQALKLYLLNCWTNFSTYINHPEESGPRKMSFLFRDHTDIAYSVTRRFVHFNRVPTSKSDVPKSLEIPLTSSAVLHLRTLNRELDQIKQAWYRVQEVKTLGRSSNLVNATYRYTLLLPTDLSSLPFSLPDFLNSDSLQLIKAYPVDKSWFSSAVKIDIHNNSKYKFVNLDIWHISSLREEYKARFGKLPKKSQFTKLVETFTLKCFHLRWIFNFYFNKILHK